MRKFVFAGLLLASVLLYRNVRTSVSDPSASKSPATPLALALATLPSTLPAMAPRNSPTTLPAQAKRATASVEASAPTESFAPALALLNQKSSTPWSSRVEGVQLKLRSLSGGRWRSVEGGGPQESARAFVAEFATGLFGVDAKQLKMRDVSFGERTRVVYVQEVEGWAVYGATLSLFFEAGELVRVQSDLESPIGRKVEVPESASTQTIFQLYQSSRPDPGAVTLSLSAPARPILFPASQALVAAYEFSTREGSGEQATSFRVIYDPQAHRVIKRWRTAIE